MKVESYTPGHTKNASDFMVKSDAHLVDVLDISMKDFRTTVVVALGTITLGIARRVSLSEVVGVDFGQSQIDRAITLATDKRVNNVRFQVADCYSLPFGDSSFHRIFSHEQRLVDLQILYGALRDAPSLSVPVGSLACAVRIGVDSSSSLSTATVSGA